MTKHTHLETHCLFQLVSFHIHELNLLSFVLTATTISFVFITVTLSLLSSCLHYLSHIFVTKNNPPYPLSPKIRDPTLCPDVDQLLPPYYLLHTSITNIMSSSVTPLQTSVFNHLRTLSYAFFKPRKVYYFLPFFFVFPVSVSWWTLHRLTVSHYTPMQPFPCFHVSLPFNRY